MEALLDKLEGPRILVVRGLRVILDEDLAGLYGGDDQGPQAGGEEKSSEVSRGVYGKC